jgi:phage tail-like protein
MSRGMVSDHGRPLQSSAPVGAVLPGILQEDPLLLQLCGMLDDLVAPVVAALDCFDAYLDPALAPADFLPWLGALLGASSERLDIASATADHAQCGTVGVLRRHAAYAAGVDLAQVTVIDPGGVSWSQAPGHATSLPPGTEPIRVVVQVAADEAARVDELAATTRVALERWRPAYLPLEVEVSVS